MRTIAILPVKSFGAAKQRLGELLGGGSRQALARAMFADVLAALRHVPALDEVVVVTGDRAAEWAARSERVRVLADPREEGQSAAALIGLRHAREHGFDRALLVPGDAPLLDPAELEALLGREPVAEREVAIVPDRHRSGTNALLLCPPDAFEPSFGPDSFERHLAAAEAAGAAHHVEELPSLTLDVDTPGDLAEVAQRLQSRRGLAPQTRGALSQLGRMGALPTPAAASA
jgi:2-phospho-L-lactate guanylyltransferase